MTTIAVMTDMASAILFRIADILTGIGAPGYVVGGYVRDRIAGRETPDVDIAVGRDATQIAAQIARELGGVSVVLDADNVIARVIVSGDTGTTQFDFASFSGTIEEDLARRDFTLDAMAVPVGDMAAGDLSRLLDPFGGRADLNNRLLRAVSDGAFRDDPARLLRGMRLGAELNLAIEPGTRSMFARDAALLARVPGERLREEFVRLLDSPRAGRWLTEASDLGLLAAIMPELAQASGIDQPGMHYWDVLAHSLNTVHATEFLLRESDWPYSPARLDGVPWSDATARHFGETVSGRATRRAMLKLAALLHDVAKPQTKTTDDTGRVHFFGHPVEGAMMAATIMQRLRFSNLEIALVAAMVNEHLRPIQMSAGDDLPTRKAVYRFFRDAGDAALDTLYLSLADFLATEGPNFVVADWNERLDVVNHILAEHETQAPRMGPPRVLDGHDLMTAFGLTPGPELGALLKVVNEAWATGEIKTREDAMDLVTRMLRDKHNT